MSILQNKELIKKYEKEIFHFKHTALKTIENLESSLKDRLYLAHLFSDEDVMKKLYDDGLKLIKAEQIISSESFDAFEEFHIESIDGDYQSLLKLITIKENYFSKGNKENDSVKTEESNHNLNSNASNTGEKEVKVVDKRKLESILFITENRDSLYKLYKNIANKFNVEYENNAHGLPISGFELFVEELGINIMLVTKEIREYEYLYDVVYDFTYDNYLNANLSFLSSNIVDQIKEFKQKEND